mmetsp:Transcript_35791/g.80819  ORF Transcript_35791/g.80819 Transcript_35791/m.80819 type:complete len:131 (+) Transcript_35791:808-1200(+)
MCSEPAQADDNWSYSLLHRVCNTFKSSVVLVCPSNVDLHPNARERLLQRDYQGIDDECVFLVGPAYDYPAWQGRAKGQLRTYGSVLGSESVRMPHNCPNRQQPCESAMHQVRGRLSSDSMSQLAFSCDVA